MQKRCKIIIIFLGEIFILAAFINHLFAKENNTKDVMGRPIVEYKTEDLRDPFWYPKEKEEPKELPQKQVQGKPLPLLIVQGVVWGGTLPQAIINNKVVRIGDTIEGARIIDIDKEKIIISFDNREYSLSSPGAINLRDSKRELEGGINEK